ncbi:MAG: hypothetical protein GY804_12280 [Alphaproteobacteria bacterium]|nr:hypothetical protein [Alphaproteobacteria bacterium]
MHKEITHFTVDNLNYNTEQTFVKFSIDGVSYIGKIDATNNKGIVFTTPTAGVKRLSSASYKALSNKDTMIELEILKAALEGDIFESTIHFEHGGNCKPPPEFFIKKIKNTLIDEITGRFKKCYGKTIKHKRFNDKNPYTPFNSLQ